MIEQNKESLNYLREVVESTGDNEALISLDTMVSISTDLLEKVKKLESLKHETVAQWEGRTGDVYPEDGPVWYYNVMSDGVNDYWSVEEYAYSVEELPRSLLIIANHHGKPS